MENNIAFKKDYFIKNYDLTYVEYYLLPEDERMEYAHQRYGWILKKIPAIGQKQKVAGHIPSRFEEYFKANGCEIGDFDLGDIETEITRVNENSYTSSPIAKKRLDSYIELVANVKASIIKWMLTSYINKIGEEIKEKHSFSLDTEYINSIITMFKGESLSSPLLSDEPKELLISTELHPMVDRLKKMQNVEVSKNIPDDYIKYLEKIGFAVTRIDKGPILVKKVTTSETN